VIIVDDGIATGATLVPVLELCRKKNAAQVIIAAPVSGTRFDPRLQEADHVEILHQPEEFNAVSQAYEKFGEFTDEAVVALLKKAETELK
jgi:putative phosphoribosyl transferase